MLGNPEACCVPGLKASLQKSFWPVSKEFKIDNLTGDQLLISIFATPGLGVKYSTLCAKFEWKNIKALALVLLL